jgi:predicted ATPase with chaperone activity
LQQYCEATTAQAVRPAVTKNDLRAIFSDLVIEEEMVTDLGAAIMTGGVIFLYGPTGNGKTSIAERLPRMFKDLVYIPYAVDVSGHTIKVFDPVVHQAYKQQPENVDSRWVLCHRPSLTVGGELRAEMLEPQLDDVTRICVGPVQMRANNGILIIDDFGRQRMDPRELLNRWIVPLDRHVDHLSLWSGVTFEIPFELLVVMATNLKLSDLAEEAFIRRLKNKIKVEAMTKESFVQVLRRVAKDRGLTSSDEMEKYAVEQCAEHTPDGLRACYPRDILNILCGVAAFEQRPPTFDKASMDRALNLYFVH